jgi:ankyrin repeat protein
MTCSRAVLLVCAGIAAAAICADAQALHFFKRAKPPVADPLTLDSPSAAQAKAALRTKQFDAALHELQTGADHGEVQSEYLLGLVHANGIGVPVSLELAKRWLAAAAAKSHAEAAFALSGLLAEGSEQERSEAVEWLSRAAREGHPIAARLTAAHALPLAASHVANGDRELARELLIWALHRHDESAMDAFVKVAGIDAEDEFGRTPLEYAVIDGSQTVVRHLLSAGAQASHADKAGVTALMLAAEGDNPAVLDAILQAGHDPDAVDGAGNTALDHAARVGRLEMLGRLLAAGARSDIENGDGWTAMDIATKSGHADVVQSLRKAGAAGRIKVAVIRDSNGIDVAHGGEMYSGWPPIAIAASRNDAKGVQDQLAAGALPDELTPQRDTSLMIAAKYQAPAVIGSLLHAGADPARADEEGQTPLVYATAHDEVDVVDALLEKGVSPDTHSRTEAPALVTASRLADQAMVKHLLEVGADVNVVSPAGVTATMAAAGGTDAELLRMLLAAKPSLAFRDHMGRDALWFASLAGNDDMIDLLLTAGAPLDAAGGRQSPLFAAVRSEKADALARLLHKGLPPNAKNSEGDTPLIAAAVRGNMPALRVLLEGGAAVNAQNDAGNTALIAAAREGNVDVCKALLKAGANASLRNQERIDALDTAKRRNLPQIAALLDTQ